MLTPEEPLKRALGAYKSGNLLETERLCSALLEIEGEVFDALHLLAVVQTRLGRTDAAPGPLTEQVFDDAIFARMIAGNAWAIDT